MPYFYKLVGWVYCKRKVRINFCMRGNAAAAAYIFYILLAMRRIRMKKRLVMAAVAVLTGSMTYSTLAEEYVFEMSPVVVTANRVNENLVDARSDISVVTSRQIEKLHLNTVEDALRTVPGTQYLNYGGNGLNANLSGIRINGSKDIILLVDGVRVTDFNGANNSGYMYSSLLNNMDNVERIEVLRGSAGALYGSGAKGGVINIITKNPGGKKTTVDIARGTGGREIYKLTTMGRVGKFSYMAYYDKVVPVSKQLYLNLLKEIKLLRFKAHMANDWNLPSKEKVYRDITELLFEFWRDQRNGAYKMAENKNTVKAETAVPEVKVGVEKVALFKKHLEDAKISGFGIQDFKDDVHSQAFRSNLPVAGQNLPFMILFDDSVYTIIQVQVAAAIVTKEKKATVCEELNALNDQYRMLKYSVDEAGNVLLTCCIPAGLDHFDAPLVVAILNQIQGHLNAVYPTIMEKLWKK